MELRSGLINMEVGYLKLSGIGGYGWSSRAKSSDAQYAHDLHFNDSGVYPSDGVNSRGLGFPPPLKAKT